MDGETNLKPKTVPNEHVKEDHIPKVSGKLMCDKPHPSLESWDGILTFDFPENMPINVKINNLLL